MFVLGINYFGVRAAVAQLDLIAQLALCSCTQREKKVIAARVRRTIGKLSRSPFFRLPFDMANRNRSTRKSRAREKERGREDSRQESASADILNIQACHVQSRTCVKLSSEFASLSGVASRPFLLISHGRQREREKGGEEKTLLLI